jgi:hypothetical protein
MFTALLQATEKERKAEHDLTLETAIEYKTHWEDELERRTALGIVGPDPIPHPDDVIINVKTGEVHITGPVTKQEKVAASADLGSSGIASGFGTFSNARALATLSARLPLARSP